MSTFRVPWDYSDSGTGVSKVANIPSDLGRELGYHLSRLADDGVATWPEAPERCDDCAARFNTDPNGCEATLSDFLKCVAEGNPFDCHRRPGLCAGYVIFRHGFKATEVAE